MPLSSEYGSSAVSESWKDDVISRDGGLCVLCGMDPVDVAHIVDGDCDQIDWIREVAPSLSGFTTNDASNLICLCPTHHRQFVSGYFVLVPSKQQREAMIEYERLNFALREEIVARVGREPGRTFPELVHEYEYIPVRGGRVRLYVHNSTPYDPDVHLFDSADYQPCPLLHFQASHIALMVESQRHLSTVIRMQTPKGDVAEPQIATLLRLYGRKPGQPVLPTTSIPENFANFLAQLRQLPAPAHPASFANDGSVPNQTSKPSVSTSVSSQAEDAEDDTDMHARAEIQSREYAKERSVTCEDLENRPPLFGGEALGPLRFASANDVCHFDV